MFSNFSAHLSSPTRNFTMIGRIAMALALVFGASVVAALPNGEWRILHYLSSTNVKYVTIVNCVWGSWGAWTSCPACDATSRNRTRTVIQEAMPGSGGMPCEEGDSLEMSTCDSTQTMPCPPTTPACVNVRAELAEAETRCLAECYPQLYANVTVLPPSGIVEIAEVYWARNQSL